MPLVEIVLTQARRLRFWGLFPSRFNRFRVLVYFLLTLALVTACGNDRSTVPGIPNASPVPMRVVKHAMGETQIPVNPQRVVTLDTGHLANALALGVQPIGSTAWYRTQHQTGLTPVEPYLQNRDRELIRNPAVKVTLC